MRKVKLAKNAGFCFGVQRAVEEAIRIQKEYMKKVYTLGPLIHNNDVVKYLEEHHIFAIDLPGHQQISVHVKDFRLIGQINSYPYKIIERRNVLIRKPEINLSETRSVAYADGEDR